MSEVATAEEIEALRTNGFAAVAVSARPATSARSRNTRRTSRRSGSAWTSATVPAQIFTEAIEAFRAHGNTIDADAAAQDLQALDDGGGLPVGWGAIALFILCMLFLLIAIIALAVDSLMNGAGFHAAKLLMKGEFVRRTGKSVRGSPLRYTPCSAFLRSDLRPRSHVLLARRTQRATALLRFSTAGSVCAMTMSFPDHSLGFADAVDMFDTSPAISIIISKFAMPPGKWRDQVIVQPALVVGVERPRSAYAPHWVRCRPGQIDSHRIADGSPACAARKMLVDSVVGIAAAQCRRILAVGPWRPDPTQDLHDRYGRTYLHWSSHTAWARPTAGTTRSKRLQLYRMTLSATLVHMCARPKPRHTVVAFDSQ
jgi:hypothetical protein